MLRRLPPPLLLGLQTPLTPPEASGVRQGAAPFERNGASFTTGKAHAQEKRQKEKAPHPRTDYLGNRTKKRLRRGARNSIFFCFMSSKQNKARAALQKRAAVGGYMLCPPSLLILLRRSCTKAHWRAGTGEASEFGGALYALPCALIYPRARSTSARRSYTEARRAEGEKKRNPAKLQNGALILRIPARARGLWEHVIPDPRPVSRRVVASSRHEDDEATLHRQRRRSALTRNATNACSLFFANEGESILATSRKSA